MTVERDIPMQIDLGLLTVCDTLTAKNSDETRLMSRARDCCQLLVNDLFQAERKTDEDGVFCILPQVTTVLPREKPLPKPKVLTTWEKFAKNKGIVKKKTSAVVHDDETNEFKPRFGRHSKANEQPWLIEGKSNDAMNKNPYKEKKQEKKERVSKNEQQRERNIKKKEKKQELSTMITQTEKSRSVPKTKKRKSSLVQSDTKLNERNKMQKLMHQVMSDKSK